MLIKNFKQGSVVANGYCILHHKCGIYILEGAIDLKSVAFFYFSSIVEKGISQDRHLW